jgi:hypothetical protein
MKTKNIWIVVAVAKPSSKTARLPFSQHVVDANRAIVSGPFWSYADAEQGWRDAGSNKNNRIVRTDQL